MVALLDPKKIKHFESQLERYKALLAQKENLDREIAALVKELKTPDLAGSPSASPASLGKGQRSADRSRKHAPAGVAATPQVRPSAAAQAPAERPKTRHGPLSEEHKRKISEAQKRRHRERRKAQTK